jgi:XXXCH domain-containing protein
MGSWKTGHELAADGLPQFLRDLAQALETGAADGQFDGLPLRELRKLVLVAERHDSGLTLKLKAKRSGELRVPTTRQGGGKPSPKGGPQDTPAGRRHDGRQAARDKYRQLKKTLQADFKALQALGDQGRLPEAETLESFLSLAELMGQGEQPGSAAAQVEMAQANTMFLDDCQALRRACAARDAAALAVVLERLARRKSACHAQFR